MFKTIKLPFRVKLPILACGADTKGAFALAEGNEAFLFDGFGDLSDPDNLARYESSVKGAIRRLGIRPSIIACDLHPGYLSSRFAEAYTLSAKRYTLFKVQHHEAHVASCIVDNSIHGDVIGVAFDGTGYGTDGNVWGGEFFVGSAKAFTRAGHFEYVAMPGGEAAIREPWRMAASYVYKASGRCGDRSIKKMIDSGFNSPLTSSAGRLFDGAGSVILRKDTVTKEAEIPVIIEKMSDVSCRGYYDIEIRPEGPARIIATGAIIKGILRDMDSGGDKGFIAAKFHNTIARAVHQMALGLRKRFRLNRVALSGGVFTNRFLRERSSEMLEGSGFDVYQHRAIAAGDGGIPAGQVAIANACRGQRAFAMNKGRIRCA